MTPDIIIHGERHRFVPHNGWSRTVPTLERFAESMTAHGILCRAAAECGIGIDYATRLRIELRKLGYGL